MNPILSFFLNVLVPLVINNDGFQETAAAPIAAWLSANLSPEDPAIAKFLRLIATKLDKPAATAAAR